ncbi:uncharacterized protein LOC112088451 [Eutrema salsugineum]|uniref:uncharacterized protein LOC112088451 n=1 Tax=Eutrema salsugineum TaxID=72664 RepID=UPI000CED45ED|nr:uncharacterized protein LOC112088451 [Eutrema salsugineum]
MFPKAAEYLENGLPLEKWARWNFKGDKYNLDTSNACESMNNVFKKARKYALLPLIDAYVEKVSEWFNMYRNNIAGASYSKKRVPFVENELHKQCAIATKLDVTELNLPGLEYSVVGVDGKSYLVNLDTKSCGCHMFDIDKIPCVHAIAATIAMMRTSSRRRDLHIFDLCSRYYLIDTWAMAYHRTIYMVPHHSTWIIPEENDSMSHLWSLLEFLGATVTGEFSYFINALLSLFVNFNSFVNDFAKESFLVNMS